VRPTILCPTLFVVYVVASETNYGKFQVLGQGPVNYQRFRLRRASLCVFWWISITPSVRGLTSFYSKLLWQYGDRHYQANRWDTAVDWFLGGTHQLFRGFSEGTMKCYRKAALCYIQQREYASAAAVIRLCPGNEAATHYISLLTSVKQGIHPSIIFSAPHANGFIPWFMIRKI
jgi:hypothetical protein